MKRMKEFVCMLLAVVLVVGMVPVSMAADWGTSWGRKNDAYTVTLNERTFLIKHEASNGIEKHAVMLDNNSLLITHPYDVTKDKTDGRLMRGTAFNTDDSISGNEAWFRMDVTDKLGNADTANWNQSTNESRSPALVIGATVTDTATEWKSEFGAAQSDPNTGNTSVNFLSTYLVDGKTIDEVKLARTKNGNFSAITKSLQSTEDISYKGIVGEQNYKAENVGVTDVNLVWDVHYSYVSSESKATITYYLNGKQVIKAELTGDHAIALDKTAYGFNWFHNWSGSASTQTLRKNPANVRINDLNALDAKEVVDAAAKVLDNSVYYNASNANQEAKQIINSGSFVEELLKQLVTDKVVTQDFADTVKAGTTAAAQAYMQWFQSINCTNNGTQAGKVTLTLAGQSADIEMIPFAITEVSVGGTPLTEVNGKYSLILNKGDKVSVTVKVNDEKYYTSSSFEKKDHSDSTVDIYGMDITGVSENGEGIALTLHAEWSIDCSNRGYLEKLFNVKVLPDLPAPTVTIPDTLALTVGDSDTLTPNNVTPSGAAVTWTSSDAAVATVDANGSVTAVAAGTATITVTVAANGQTAADTCIVTVAAPEPEEPEINWDIMAPIMAALLRKYDVEYTAGEGGTVDVSHPTVAFNGNSTYTVIPDDGYEIVSASLNGKAVELAEDGTLLVKNIRRDQMLEVVFAKKAWVNPYSDVSESDPDYAVIQAVSEAGLMNGIGGAFAAGEKVTVGMFVTMLGRLHGVDVTEYTEISFVDVKAGDYFAPYVEWAAANGISNGKGNGVFGVHDEISFERAVTLLARYAHFIGMDITAAASLKQYADSDEVSDWAADAMAWAVAVGIYAPEAELNPQDSMTRLDTAKMFYALMLTIAE